MRGLGALAGVVGVLEFPAAPTGVRSLGKPCEARAGEAAPAELRGTFALAAMPSGFCCTLACAAAPVLLCGTFASNVVWCGLNFL